MATNPQARINFQKTEIGWIPKEWEIDNLSSVSEILVSNVDKKVAEDEIPVRLCNYLDVYQNGYIDDRLDFMAGSATKEEISKFAVKDGDILITKDSETSEDIASAAIVTKNIVNLICGYHLAIIRPKSNQINSNYLVKTLGHSQVHHQFVIKANGVTRFGLTYPSIKEVLIPIPPVDEQQKIAEILSTWDRAIERVEKLINAKQRLKKGLMQQLLTGRMRFPEFGEPVKKHEIPKKWEGVRISKFFKEKFDRNKNNSFDLVLSCSKLYGIIAQADRFEKRIASVNTTKYKIVHKNDLVYDPMLLWDGSIGFVVNYDNGLVSPAYNTFEYKGDEGTFEYLKHFLYSCEMKHYYKVISQGTNLRRRKAPSDAFLNTRIILPQNSSEIKAIASILSLLDKESVILKNKKATLEKQKRGLMKNLLTGKVRVRISK